LCVLFAVCLIARWLVCLLACLFACLLACFIACLLTCLLACLLAYWLLFSCGSFDLMLTDMTVLTDLTVGFFSFLSCLLACPMKVCLLSTWKTNNFVNENTAFFELLKCDTFN
jgi:hypothetical protein